MCTRALHKARSTNPQELDWLERRHLTNNLQDSLAGTPLAQETSTHVPQDRSVQRSNRGIPANQAHVDGSHLAIAAARSLPCQVQPIQCSPQTPTLIHSGPPTDRHSQHMAGAARGR